MTSKGDHYVSDTDSDITIGPDEESHDSPQKVKEGKQASLTKRRSEVHEISESDEESEEFFILKGKSKNKKKHSLSLKKNIETATKSPVKKSKSFTETDSKSPVKKIKSFTETDSKSPVKKIKSFTETDTKSPVKKTKSFTEIDNWLDQIDDASNEKDNAKLKTNTNENAKKERGKYSAGSPLSVGLKRKQTVLLEEDKKLPSCQYGVSCYRKNPSHFKEFSHSGNITITVIYT
jgi:hypothetical protein